MRCVSILSLILAVTFVSGVRAEDAAGFREKGIKALKESQTNPHRVVEAATCFAEAVALYAQSGDDEKIVEMNSFLFWCRKRMSQEDIDRFLKSSRTAVAEKLESVEKTAPKLDEAKIWLERAEKFARENPGEHFLIAIRFNEIATRFKGSEVSFVALDRSLQEQELSLNTAPPPPPPAAPIPAPAETAKSPVHTADPNDPLQKRIRFALDACQKEWDAGRKLVFDVLNKRETEARGKGDKKAVDQIKLDRATYQADATKIPFEAIPPENRKKIETAHLSVVAAYEYAMREYTKLRKDAEADAADKESAAIKNEWAAITGALSPAPVPEPVEPAKAPNTAKSKVHLIDKTLVAFVRPASLAQRGGSVLTIDDGQNQFDGIVFAELEPGRWMAGSDGYARTTHDQKTFPKETALSPGLIEIAITYHEREVTLFYNGKKAAHYSMAVAPLTFQTDPTVVFGRRHLSNPADHFFGEIVDARIYDRALSEEQMAALRPSQPTMPAPWAWWTFETGTVRDRMGRFPVGQLLEGAKIQDGRLVLDGKKAWVSCPLRPK